MNILFITSSRIGDAVLSSGLLNHIEQTYPDAKVTIACGPLAASLFEGYPLLERVIVLKKQSFKRHWIKLFSQTVGTSWDMVIDLRDSAVSRMVRCHKRYVFSNRINRGQHKVKQNAQVMKLSNVPAPKLWFSTAQKSAASDLIPKGGPVLGVGPTANWIGKTWPADRFIQVIKFLTEPGGLMEGARVAVFAAPGEEEAAIKVLESVPSSKRLDVIAKTDPGTAAATLARCDFYLGNDSGLMHCAAAVGVPTFGVFGPSYPLIYRPYGDHTSYARTPETFDELIDFEGYDPKTLTHTLMGSLSVSTVKRKITEFLQKQEAA